MRRRIGARRGVASDPRATPAEVIVAGGRDRFRYGPPSRREAAFRDPSRPVVAYSRQVFEVTAIYREGVSTGDIGIESVGSGSLYLSVSVAREYDLPTRVSHQA